MRIDNLQIKSNYTMSVHLLFSTSRVRAVRGNKKWHEKPFMLCKVIL